MPAVTMSIPHLLLFLAVARAACPPGSHWSDGKCAPCPAGTWQSATDAASCTRCAPGKSTLSAGAEGGDVCFHCGTGTYSAGGSACRACPSGTTSVSGADSLAKCVTCGPGMRAGRFLPGCVTCDPGTYSSDVANAFCTRCPSGTSSAAGAKSVAECRRVVCGVGEQAVDGLCVPCVDGMFKRAQSTDACRMCPLGMESSADRGGCSPCAAGFYRDAEVERCVKCPERFVALGKGSTVCRMSNAPCPQDAFETRFGSCVACATDQYVNVDEGVCELCPSGEISLRSTSTRCRKCPQGMVVSDDTCQCKHGHELVHGQCQPCQVGYYNDGSFFSKCALCPSGSYAPRRGLAECWTCPRGKYPSKDRAYCQSCPEGYTTDIGPPVPHVEIEWAESDVCRDGRSGCPDGFGRHVPFRSRTYVECVAQICQTYADEQCRRCESGMRPRDQTRSPTPLSPCVPCENGMVSDGITCRKCPSGMVRDDDRGHVCMCGVGRGLVGGLCRKCPPGTFSGVDDELCRKCAPGSFAAGFGWAECSLCQAGMVAAAGASECQSCPAGMSSYGRHESRCMKLKDS